MAVRNFIFHLQHLMPKLVVIIKHLPKENINHNRYNDQLVNADQGNNRCLLQKSNETCKYTLWVNSELCIVKASDTYGYL
jgi:hypothetical protein